MIRQHPNTIISRLIATPGQAHTLKASEMQKIMTGAMGSREETILGDSLSRYEDEEKQG
jgi:hypothetical protein